MTNEHDERTTQHKQPENELSQADCAILMDALELWIETEQDRRRDGYDSEQEKEEHEAYVADCEAIYEKLGVMLRGLA